MSLQAGLERAREPILARYLRLFLQSRLRLYSINSRPMSSASSSSAGDAEGNDEESLPSGPALTATVRVSPLTGGVVTSGVPGINCGDGHTDCELSLAWGETLTLMADVSAGYEFAGWVGACTGTDTCTISAAVSAVSVEAVFDQLPTMSSDSSSSAGDAEGNDEESLPLTNPL